MLSACTSLHISELPEIIAILYKNEIPEFVIIEYSDFVKLAARCGGNIPDIVLISREGRRDFAAICMVGFIDMLRSFVICGDIDTVHYLSEHKDVAAAIMRGELADAKTHYVFTGYIERRAVEFVRLEQAL